MAFKSNTQRRTGNAGAGGGSETVAVRLKALNLVDKDFVAAKRPPKSHNDDTMTAYLMHDAFGMVAQFDENGGPITEVTVKLRPSDFQGEHKPYVLADFRKGAKKDAGPKMGANPVIILENAWVDRNTKEVSCGWVKCAMPDSADTISPNLEGKFDHIFPAAWCTVQNEKATEVDGETKRKQNRQLVWPQAAVSVNDKAELLKDGDDGIKNYLYPNPDYAGGQPIIILRLTQQNPPMTLATATISGGMRNEAGDLKSADEVIQEFFDYQEANDKDENKEANFSYYLDDLENQRANEPDQGYTIEVIPGYRYTTGSKSMPSQQKAGRTPDHEAFRSFVLDENNEAIQGEGYAVPLMSAMYTRAHMTVKRGDFEDGPGFWYATSTQAVRGVFRGEATEDGKKTWRPNANALHFPITELPTAATPEVVAAHFEMRAAKRQEIAASLNPRNSRTAAASTPAEDDIPDNTAGLTMTP